MSLEGVAATWSSRQTAALFGLDVDLAAAFKGRLLRGLGLGREEAAKGEKALALYFSAYLGGAITATRSTRRRLKGVSHTAILESGRYNPRRGSGTAATFHLSRTASYPATYSGTNSKAAPSA